MKPVVRQEWSPSRPTIEKRPGEWDRQAVWKSAPALPRADEQLQTQPPTELTAGTIRDQGIPPVEVRAHTPASKPQLTPPESPVAGPNEESNHNSVVTRQNTGAKVHPETQQQADQGGPDQAKQASQE